MMLRIKIGKKANNSIMSHSEESKLQNLLSAVTDALLAEKGDIDQIIAQYGVERGSVDGLVNIIRRLHLTLVGQQPSDRFVQRLRQDLLGDNSGVFSRLRFLPARVQIAAGFTLVAGFMLFTRRRIIDDAKKSAEMPAL